MLWDDDVTPEGISTDAKFQIAKHQNRFYVLAYYIANRFEKKFKDNGNLIIA